MVKRRLFSILMLLVVLTSCVIVFLGCEQKQSIKVPQVQEDVYVYDQDECISDEVELEINNIIKELNQKTEAEFAIISIPSLNGYTIEEYSNELFNKLGIGKKGKDNGVLLLFSKTDNRVRLEIGRGLEGCLNDAKCGRILDDNFVPYREEGDYTKATSNTVKAVVAVIAKEYNIELEKLGEVETKDTQKDEIPTWKIILYIIIIIVYIAIRVASDSSGGGYRGGFSGGGRSGGFGGGRSGGGGASR